MKSHDYDAIVLGDGIAGLGVARALAGERKKVLVIGKKDRTGQATCASAGMLDPVLEINGRSPLLDFGLEAFKDYRARVRRLEAQTRMATDYARTGILSVALNAGECRQLKRWAARYAGAPLKARFLKPSEIRRRGLPLSGRAFGALWFPTLGKINPRKLYAALLRSSQKMGIRFLNTDQPAAPLFGRKGIEGVGCRGRVYRSRILVNAAGAWSGKTQPSAQPEAVVPVRGQILILKGKLPLKAIVQSVHGHYIVPWKKDRWLLGSTVERAGFNVRTNAQALAGIRRAVEQIVPAVKHLRYDTSWAGLRPYAEDALPVLGAGSVPGLYWATGYYRSGILLGMHAGRELAKGILRGKMPKSLKAFNPKRLGY